LAIKYDSFWFNP